MSPILVLKLHARGLLPGREPITRIRPECARFRTPPPLRWSLAWSDPFRDVATLNDVQRRLIREMAIGPEHIA